jgi:hypothetical protein
MNEWRLGGRPNIDSLFLPTRLVCHCRASEALSGLLLRLCWRHQARGSGEGTSYYSEAGDTNGRAGIPIQ